MVKRIQLLNMKSTIHHAMPGKWLATKAYIINHIRISSKKLPNTPGEMI